MCSRARFTQYSLLLISQLVSLFHIYTLCLSHVVLASTLFLFFLFFFEVNDLLHGAQWQSMVATL